MIDLLLLILLSIFILKMKVWLFLTAFISGFLIALLFGGTLSIVKIIPAFVLTITTPVIWALVNNLPILNAGIVGLLVFAGYLCGSMANVLLFPVKFVTKIIKKIL